jgi:hypothetical protein
MTDTAAPAGAVPAAPASAAPAAGPGPAAAASARDLELVRRYEPVLRLTAGELFAPVPVADYLASAALLSRGAAGARQEPKVLAEQGSLTPELLVDLAQRHPGEELSLQYVQEPMGRKELRRFRASGQMPAFQRSSAAAAVGILARLIAAIARLTLVVRGMVPGGQAARAYQQALAADSPCTYYAHVTRDGGYIALQYWFLYPMNDWRSTFGGVNDHEADWEQVTIFLAETETGPVPAWVAFSSHDEVGADLRRRWDDPDLELVGDHPVVYAGAGSHSGAYLPGEYLVSVAPELPRWFETIRRRMAQILPWSDPDSHGFGIPYIDYRRGDGRRIGAGGDPWQAVLVDDQVPWVREYRGLWGLDTGDPLGGERAPAGPRYERNGTVRPSWAQPVAWADLDGEAPDAQQREAAWQARPELLAAALETTTADLERARERLRSVRVAALAPDHAGRPSPAEVRLAEEAVVELRRHQYALRYEAEELDQPRPLPPPPGVHDHLRHRLVPMGGDGTTGPNALLKFWSSISAVLLLGAVGVLLLAGSRSAIAVPLLVIAGVVVLVEALLRRRLGALVVRVAIAAAAVVAGLFLLDVVLANLRQATGAVLLGAAIYLAVSSLLDPMRVSSSQSD